MKSAFRRTSMMVLAMMLVLGMCIPAYGADSAVSFGVDGSSFTVEPGSGYTESDLFDGFKNVMPGDVLTETVSIRHDGASEYDLIKVYLKALPHDAEGNPLSYSEPFEEEDGKDQQEEDVKTGLRDEDEVSIADFLSQLNLKVRNGEEVLYEGPAHESGSLTDNLLLCELKKGEQHDLTVELSVPIELGNEYANRVGEVDWIFTVEAFQYTSITVTKEWVDIESKENPRPKSVTVELRKDGEGVERVTLNAGNRWTHTFDLLDADYEWTVAEVNVPSGYRASYKVNGEMVTITNTSVLIQTGQLNWPIVVLGGIGGMLVLIGIVLVLKKRKEEHA